MNSTSKKTGTPAAGARRSSPEKGTAKKAETKKSVSPLERWKMVTEAAYYRAQARGFLGGDSMEDWREAEKAIDAEYTVDYGKTLGVLDPSEMMDQFRKVFSGIQFPGVDLEAVIDAQRKNMEALTAANKAAFEGAWDLMQREMEMSRESVDSAAAIIDDMKAAPSAKDLPAKQTELLKKAVEKAVANMRELAEMAAKSNKEAFEIVQGRASESLEEIKKLASRQERKPVRSSH
jgi:phasin family protein